MVDAGSIAASSCCLLFHGTACTGHMQACLPTSGHEVVRCQDDRSRRCNKSTAYDCRSPKTMHNHGMEDGLWRLSRRVTTPVPASQDGGRRSEVLHNSGEVWLGSWLTMHATAGPCIWQLRGRQLAAIVVAIQVHVVLVVAVCQALHASCIALMG